MNVKQAVKRLVWRRVRRILSGAGRGLRFDGTGYSLSYLLGSIEKPVQEVLFEHLKPGMTFFDVGANSGFFSVIAARLVGPAGHVYAFEPVPANVSTVVKNAALNLFDHITVVPKAAGAVPGRAMLLVTEHPGGATLDAVGITPPDLKEKIVVEVLSLDAFVDETGRAPDLVKIDVEGAERDVLLGMEGLLQDHRPILLYEIDAAGDEEFEVRRAEADSYVQARNYTIHHLAGSYAPHVWRVGHTVAFPG